MDWRSFLLCGLFGYKAKHALWWLLGHRRRLHGLDPIFCLPGLRMQTFAQTVRTGDSVYEAREITAEAIGVTPRCITAVSAVCNAGRSNVPSRGSVSFAFATT